LLRCSRPTEPFQPVSSWEEFKIWAGKYAGWLERSVVEFKAKVEGGGEWRVQLVAPSRCRLDEYGKSKNYCLIVGQIGPLHPPF